MEPAEAINMLANEHLNFPGAQQWADLGCGSGTFTLALAGLLHPQSMIYAMDMNERNIKQIPTHYNKVTIEKITGDFNQQDIIFKNLDGILMTNSLHYVKDKASFIKRTSAWLKEDGCFLLVEYEMEQPNQWVPYPLNFSASEKLFHKAGFSSVKKLKEKASLFGGAKLYSVLIRR
jgi:ubiquinone/menaquinone biosynthesis C-methylase UbiE